MCMSLAQIFHGNFYSRLVNANAPTLASRTFNPFADDDDGIERKKIRQKLLSC